MGEMFRKYFWFMFGKKQDDVHISREDDEVFSSPSVIKRMVDNTYFRKTALK